MPNSPISWTGGKRLLRKEILKRVPEHAIYCEPFSGAAWVLFAKDPNISKVGVLNDRHGELTNFYRCVRERPLELLEKLRFRLVSQEDFLKERGRDGQDQRDEVTRAASFFWRNKMSFGGKVTPKATFGYSLGRPRWNTDTVKSAIESTHERLARVYVFNEDFQKVITRLDRHDTFFYCDPPYYEVGGCYEHDLTPVDHERLADTLKGTKGKFLLSYNDSEVVRSLYSWALIEPVDTKYSLPKTAVKPVQELLISNY